MDHYKDEESEVGKWLKYTFGLPSLPAAEVEDGFSDLMAIAPPEVLHYVDYLTDSYIKYYLFSSALTVLSL